MTGEMMKVNLKRRKEMKQMKIPSPSQTIAHQVTQGEGIGTGGPQEGGGPPGDPDDHPGGK